VEIFLCYWADKGFGGGTPVFLNEFHKSIEHVAKFGDDRPSDLGHYTYRRQKGRNKKERSKRQQLNITVGSVSGAAGKVVIKEKKN